jgi:hypothetical protein
VPWLNVRSTFTHPSGTPEGAPGQQSRAGANAQDDRKGLGTAVRKLANEHLDHLPRSEVVDVFPALAGPLPGSLHMRWAFRTPAMQTCSGSQNLIDGGDFRVDRAIRGHRQKWVDASLMSAFVVR